MVTDNIIRHMSAGAQQVAATRRNSGHTCSSPSFRLDRSGQSTDGVLQHLCRHFAGMLL